MGEIDSSVYSSTPYTYLFRTVCDLSAIDFSVNYSMYADKVKMESTPNGISYISIYKYNTLSYRKIKFAKYIPAGRLISQ
jgi:hypothetical protein